MEDEEIPLNPNPNPNYLPPPSDPLESAARNGRFMSVRPPPFCFTTEFDREGPLFLHKVSCKFFDSLAKLKFSFQNNTKGEIFCSKLGFTTKNLSVMYDVESLNAILRGALNLGKNLQLQTTYDVQVEQTKEILSKQADKIANRADEHERFITKGSMEKNVPYVHSKRASQQVANPDDEGEDKVFLKLKLGSQQVIPVFEKL